MQKKGVTTGTASLPEPLSIAEQLASADALFEQENYEEMILVLNNVLEIEPANIRGYLRLADAYVAQGDKERAIELLQKGFERTGDQQLSDRITGMTQVVKGVKSVVCNGRATVLLMESGDLYYCGVPDFYPDSPEPVTVPRKLEGVDNIRSILASGGGCYIITNDDQLFGWGFCSAPLDSDYNVGGSDYRVPRKIMDGVQKISVGGSSALILKTDGALYSWGGDNQYGQMGRGLPYNDIWPDMNDEALHDVDISLVMEHVADMDMDDYGKTVCALTEGGELYLWGKAGPVEKDGVQRLVCYNTPQRLCDGIALAKVYWSRLIAITEEGKFVEIHWQPDDLSNIEMREFSEIGRKVTAMDCSDYHALIVDETGTLYTMGMNHAGQLGITDGNAPIYTPLTDTPIKAVCAGGDSSFAVTQEGVLLAWGDNAYGQLGNGRSGTQRNEERRNLILTGVKDFSGTTAITENGDLYAWGGIYGTPNVPTKVFEHVKMDNGIIVTEDGGLYVQKFQLGNPPPYLRGLDQSAFEPSAEYPAFIKIMTGVKYARRMNSSYYVIKEDGSLWVWGENYYPLLGLGWRKDQSLTKDQMVYEPVHIMDGVKKVMGETFFLKENGDVYYCGYAYPDYILKPKKIFSGVTDIPYANPNAGEAFFIDGKGRAYRASGYDNGYESQIARANVDFEVAYINYDYIVDTEGNLYEIFGMDDELPKNARSLVYEGRNLTLYYAPVDTEGVKIVTGMLLKRNGELYTWGDNQSGQLGIGDAGRDENIFTITIPE